MFFSLGKSDHSSGPERPGPIPGYVVTPYPYPNGATLSSTLVSPNFTYLYILFDVASLLPSYTGYRYEGTERLQWL